MSGLKIENIEILIDEIDCLLLEVFEDKPGMRWYKHDGEAEGCSFPTTEDRKEAWEVIRNVVLDNGFLDCDDMFLRPLAITRLTEVLEEGKDPHAQIILRGGTIVCIPYDDPAVLRTDIEALQAMIGGGLMLQ